VGEEEAQVTGKQPSKRAIEELSRTMLAMFPDRNRKSEAGRVARARAYWEAR